MPPDEDMLTHLFVLPVELFYQIIFYLDIKDILALRKTCKHVLALTKERSLWSTMFTRLRTTQALPCSRTEFLAMSSAQAERALFVASKVEETFLQLREHVAYHIPAVKQDVHASTCSWRVLAFISDRFILSANNAAVVIWDTSTLASSSPMGAPSPWAHFKLTNFVDYVDRQSTLYIAIVRIDYPSVVIYSVCLSDGAASENPQKRLHWEAEFPLQHPTELLKHMDPDTGRALLYLSQTSINIVHWRDGNRRSTISIQADDPDQGWNGITALRFCGPYVLCFRVRSVEAYPIPTDTPAANPLPMLRHRFGPVCFRAVSLSHVRVSHRPSGDVYTIFMLANDVYQGMFHCRIRVTATPVPTMSVHVLAKGSIQSDPLPLRPGTDVRYTLEDMIRRMFFSTWSLGSAGLRGVWVDRQRGSIDRRVVAFTTHPSRLKGRETVSVPAEDEEDASGEAPTVDGNVIHVISSYDLRDDITICAVSEWTGRIALGSRIGAISLL